MKLHPKHFKPCPWRNVWFAPLVIGLALLLSSGTVFAVESIFNDQGDDQALLNYWTPQRMQKAVPPDMGRGPEPWADDSAPQENPWPKDAKPGYSPGWKPGSGPQPDLQKPIEITPGHQLFKVTNGGGLPLTHAPFSPPSSPTDYVNYAPFDRHTWYGRYLNNTMAPIGKLFFTTPTGGTGECTASVIGRRTIVTAAHCLRTGDQWNTDFLFCPSYYRGDGSGAPNPTRGCWGWSMATVSSAYHNNRATDRDYGCIVTAPTNPTTGQQVGDVTGWTGRTWNLTHKQHTFSFGYPAEFPFPGYHVVSCASSEWYQINMSPNDGTVDQVSKYIGCDQTGGSSGGPWWIGILHPNRSDEYPAVDTSQETDPRQGMGGPFINGLNSHRRCSEEDCPQGTVYLSEMGSPQFRSTSGDTDESEDVFQSCLSIESGPPYPHRVIDTISVGNYTHPYGVAVTPNGNYVYVTNEESCTVSVIRTSDNTVIDTISVGCFPYGVAVTPNGSYVYIGGGTVSVIRTSDNTVIDTISVGGYGVAVTPNGNYVYVTGGGTVSVIRTSDNTVIDTISVGDGSLDVAVTPNGNYVYVTNAYDDTVSVIQASDNAVIDTIFVGGHPEGVAVTPDGNYVYVTGGGTVSVIRTSDNTVVGTVPVGGYPCGVVVTPNGSYVYVTDYGDGTVSVIRTSDNTLIDTIFVGVWSWRIAVTPNGSYVYVTNYDRAGMVAVIGF